MNAWITPGNHRMAVNIRLIKNVVLKPCFRNTAKGGKSIFRIMVKMDMVMFFCYTQNYPYNFQKFLIICYLAAP